MPGFYVGVPLTLSKLLTRWSDEGFWQRSLEHGLAAAPGSAIIYEDYVVRSLQEHNITFLPAQLPSRATSISASDTRDGIYTHVRAFGPKPRQWTVAQRHDPEGYATWYQRRVST